MCLEPLPQMMQVYLAVITNVFLSGLSSGQLAQLLPASLVPATLTHSLTAAAAARPADSTAASKLTQTATGWPLSPIGVLHGAGLRGTGMGVPGHYAAGIRSAQPLVDMCPVPSVLSVLAPGPLGVCPAGHSQLQPAVLHSIAGSESELVAIGKGLAAAGSDAATSHLLLLFVIEHLLMLAVVLVMVLVPDEPAGQSSRQPVPQLAAVTGGPPPELEKQCQNPQQAVPAGVDPAGGSAPQAAATQADIAQVAVPVRVHGNPLFTTSTARQSGVL